SGCASARPWRRCCCGEDGRAGQAFPRAGILPRPDRRARRLAMRIGLFEDAGVAQLAPLTDTCAAFDLLCGLSSLAAKQCRHFGSGPPGLPARPELAALARLAPPALPVNAPAWLRAGPAVLVNARWLPPPRRTEPALADGAYVATVEGQLAYALVEQAQLA